jgi:hypothetical protein
MEADVTEGSVAGVEGRGHRVRGFAPTPRSTCCTSHIRRSRSAIGTATAGGREGEAAAETALLPTLLKLFASEHGRIGLECFINRTTAEFVGR